MFQVMLNFLGSPDPGEEAMPALALGEAGGFCGWLDWRSGTVRLPRWASQLDLTLTLAETGGELVGTLEYSSDLFDRTTVLRWAGHWLELLRGWLADGEQRLSELPLLSAGSGHN